MLKDNDINESNQEQHKHKQRSSSKHEPRVKTKKKKKKNRSTNESSNDIPNNIQETNETQSHSNNNSLPSDILLSKYNIKSIDQKELIANNYLLLEEIDHGTFGKIYLSFSIRDNIEVSIKKEFITNKPQTRLQLRNEAQLYQTLLSIPSTSNLTGECIIPQQEIQGVPVFYGYGELKDSNYMIMELLGPNLIDLFYYCGSNRFSIGTVCLLALQLLNRIETLHNNFYIHRDIKPENFVIGNESRSNILYLIDYGLSKRYKHVKSHHHIPYREGRRLIGTARYVSINTHLGIEQSRRDDLESIAYVLIYFLKGVLPWQGLKGNNKCDKYTRIKNKKMQITTEMLCNGLPDEIAVYLNYSKSLKFEDKPDYNYLRGLFIKILTSCISVHSISKENVKFDWCFENQSALWKMYNQKQHINIVIYTENDNNNENDNYIQKSNENNIDISNSQHISADNVSEQKSEDTLEIEFDGESQAESLKNNINDTNTSYEPSLNLKDNKTMNNETNDKYIEQFIHECVLPKQLSAQYIKKQALLKHHFQQTKHNTKNTTDANYNEIVKEFNKNDSPPKDKDKHKKHKKKKHHNNNNNIIVDSDNNSDKDQDDLNNISFKANSYFRSDKPPHQKNKEEEEEVTFDQLAPKLSTYKKKINVDLEAIARSSSKKRVNVRLAKENLIKLSKEHYLKHYIVLNDLGQGSFGKVKRVRHKKLNEVRAMKIVNKRETTSTNEIEVLRKISHPNIINIFEIFEDNYQYYIMSEFCDGGELFDAITNKGYYNEIEAAKIMKQILEAVNYLHDNGVVHRDLKPENIMLLSNQTDLKLIDFGTVVQKPKRGKCLKRFIGTSYYIAPEVIQENYNEKCDIWSCGVILYILLCGYPPFNGVSNRDIYNSIQFSRVSFKKDEWYDISQEAVQLITSMLDKNPETRPHANECLNHKWFKICDANVTNKLSRGSTITTHKVKILEQMALFVQQNKFKQAVMQFITTEFNLKKDEEELKKMFKVFDKKSKGTINRESFIKQLEKIDDGAVSREIISDIFSKIDLDGSGSISYNEFLTSILDSKKFLTEDRLTKAFNTLDRDENGLLSVDEIKSFFGGDEKTWKKVLKDVDKNGDGKVDYKEFKQIMIGFDPDEIVGENTIGKKSRRNLK